jgi:hypothetical protein
MNRQPEKSHAERIASFLEQMEPMFPNPQAAAELRRLHEVNQELVSVLGFIIDNHASAVADLLFGEGWVETARAALAKARGNT